MLVVTYDTPSPLYYYCHDFTSMGGQMQTDIAGTGLTNAAADGIAFELGIYSARDGTLTVWLPAGVVSDLTGESRCLCAMPRHSHAVSAVGLGSERFSV